MTTFGEADHLRDGDTVVKWSGCPTCQGRGWLLINPFATGGGNGVGGLYNMRQCPSCERAKEHFDERGTLPVTDLLAEEKR